MKNKALYVALILIVILIALAVYASNTTTPSADEFLGEDQGFYDDSYSQGVLDLESPAIEDTTSDATPSPAM
jgi:hypothetical protein